MNADWGRLHRFAMQFLPAGFAGLGLKKSRHFNKTLLRNVKKEMEMKSFISHKTTVILLLLVFSLATLGYAQENQPHQGKSAEEVAHELANPNTSLGFLANILDYTTYDGDLPDSDDQDSWRYSFQPSFPYPIGEGMNFFLRPLIPVIIDQPVYTSNGFDSKGVDLGNIGFDAAIGKSFPSGMQLIGGVTGTLPTATDSDLNIKQYLLGPELFVGRKFDWGFLGVLVSHQWDVTGWDDSTTSITGGQYFYTVNLKNAWQIQAQPTWSYNHEADDDNKWTFPLGIGVSKTTIAGKTPWKFSLQYWYYAESPDAFGPKHQIRFQVAPVVPLPW